MSDQWYALYVPGGKEEQVKAVLEKEFQNRIDFRIFKRMLRERKQGQWHNVERKLFPGYIIIKGNIDVQTYNDMTRFYRGFKLLRDQDEFYKIQPKELEVLGLLAKEEDGLIAMSKLYKEQEDIKVIDGPLVGLEGLIIKVNARKGRAKVSLDFIGEKRIVELGIEVLSKF